MQTETCSCVELTRLKVSWSGAKWCRNRQSALWHLEPRRKKEQYLVVPKLAFSTLPSYRKPSTAYVAVTAMHPEASSSLSKVTYTP